MPYCPNCCFYFGDLDKEHCPKCGVDVRVSREDNARRRGEPADSLKEWVSENPELAGEAQVRNATAASNPGLTCPECNAPLEPSPDDGYSFDLLGREVSVSEVGVMSMVIRKRAVTQVVAQFQGYVCPSGHKYYTELRENLREICPVCKGAMVRFGTTVLTCKKCNINLTRDKFARMSSVQLLADEGWRPLR